MQVKRRFRVSLAWEPIFQLELSSHASNTAVFNFKKQGFRLPVFFTVFHLLGFVVVAFQAF